MTVPTLRYRIVPTGPLLRSRVLPSVPALQVALRVSGGFIQWRIGESGAWTNLIETVDLAPSAAEILTLLLTVDGSGSGLDADLLDGQSGAYYLAWGNFTGTPTTLAGYGITDAQGLDASLTAYANLVTAADKAVYYTAADTPVTYDISAYGRTLANLADETALEALLDTLPNLTSIQNLTVTLADAGADALWGWDDSASAYINLSAADARTALGMSANAQSLVTAADYAAMRTLLGLVIGTNVQAFDADLSALAANSTDGFWSHTGAGTGAARTLTAPAAGITISNPAGIAGNPTFALANDLSALEGLGSTGIAVRTTTDTWAQRSIAVTSSTGLSVTNGDGVSGNPTLAGIDASTTVKGVSELLTTTELLTGTDTTRTATADSIAALWDAGADNSGGATITMGEGSYFNLITSTTAITALAFTTDKAGRRASLRFNTARTLTHNATSLILPTGANITTVAGDIAGVRSLGSGNFVVEWYTRADGTPLAGGGGVSDGDKGDVSISGSGTVYTVEAVTATATNDNAAAGKVGEYVEASVLVGAAVSLTTLTAVNIMSISLTAGDWDVHAHSSFSGTSTISSVITYISSTSATLPTDWEQVGVSAGSIPSASGITQGIPPVRFSLSGTTTVYLQIRANFAGTAIGYGRLEARRAR